MPLEDGWLSQSTIKQLTKRYVKINPQIDEERFLSLVKKAQNKLLFKNTEKLKESANVEEYKILDRIEKKKTKYQKRKSFP